MHFEPTYEQTAISDVVRSIVEPWTPEAFGETDLGAEEIDKKLVEGAWTGISIPEEFGGSGFGLLEAMLVIEELGAALSPSALRSTVSARRAILAGVETSSDRDAKNQCLSWLMQLGDNSNGAVGFGSSKTATMIANAPDCDLVVLFQDGVGQVASPSELNLEPARSLDTTRTHARLAKDVECQSPSLEKNAATRALAECRALLAAELVGVSRAAMDRAVAYVSERQAFGKAIGSFQSIGHRLADTARYVDGARVMSHAAAWHADTNSPELAHFSRVALLNAQRAVKHATGTAMQVHGAFGHTWEAGIHWYQRRAHIAANLLASASELRHELAQELAQTTNGA